MKKETGITLIALVVTIVVLIILASVAITLSLGDNGVFKKASKAKEDTKVAQNEESMQIAETTNSIDEIVGTRDTVNILKEEYEQLKSLANSAVRYIDYQNVIAKESSTSEDETGEVSYTLQQDAAVFAAAYITSSATNMYIYVNDIEIRRYWYASTGSIYEGEMLYLKKGDTIKVKGRKCGYTVYAYR